MSMSAYYRVKLLVSDQFGPKGPKAGAQGRTGGPAIHLDDEVWYHVFFRGFEGYYIVREDMIERRKGY